MNNIIYMDNHATTPIASEVLDAMIPYLTTHFGNAASTHPFGVTAKDAVEKARQQVAELLGCSASGNCLYQRCDRVGQSRRQGDRLRL